MYTFDWPSFKKSFQLQNFNAENNRVKIITYRNISQVLFLSYEHFKVGKGSKFKPEKRQNVTNYQHKSSLYTDEFAKSKKLGTGLNFRPDAPDEKMYATFLKHEVKYTRQVLF